MNDKREFKANFAGKEIVFETGRLAKQADGAVLVSCQGTQVLVTVCSSKELKDGQDFFPLLVEYTEKFYSAGKFLGGFRKREGRPTDQEILVARLIDRPLRPLFPESYMFDTVISCTVLSYNADGGDPEVLASLGASAALSISDIPFAGPLATCKIASIDGNLIINPTNSQWEQSDIEIVLSASKDAILMVEGEAKVIPEEQILKALWFGHDCIIEFIEVINEMIREIGKKKREVAILNNNDDVSIDKVQESFSKEIIKCLETNDKKLRTSMVKSLEKDIADKMEQNPESFSLGNESNFSKEAYKGLDGALYNIMRKDILDNQKRIGGRKMDEVRNIATEVSILSNPHGSSLFTRGETQVISIITLGGSSGEQMSDRIVGVNYDSFYLHYNFPPYSVGEARGTRGVGRRELGHGNLAERAIKQVMPTKEEFPYTIRVVCEVLESNGSSSMGSVCAASMALMDAGVPIKAPVSGIAMGLVHDKDNNKFKILSDILGDEDHLGDMDFKVAGTAEGITAIQMDIKINGLTREIIEEAISQAKDGRMHILNEMAKTIKTSREELKSGVAMIEKLSIPESKIGALIGPSGKNIKGLQEQYDVTIEVEDDGKIKVLGTDSSNLKKCAEHINLQINGPSVGSKFSAKVISIKKYGAFVELAQGISGLVHISEITDKRINEVEDYVKEGDTMDVKVVEIDKLGRIKLSAKAVEPLQPREH